MQPMDQQSPMPVLNRPPVQQQRPRMRPPARPAINQQPGQEQPGMAPAPQAPPTFAQMQAQGQARPAPPQPPTVNYNGAPVALNAPPGYGQAPHGGAMPYGGQLNQSIMSALQTPSAYGTPQVMDTYKRLGQTIDDKYALKERATDEQFAKRGLYDSTAAAGAMHDLNVGHRSEEADLAAQLADKQAQDYASARQGAISQGLQGQQQGVQSALGYGNLNLANRSLDQSGALANRGMDINVQQGNDSRTVQLLQLLAALGINPQGGQ